MRVWLWLTYKCTENNCCLWFFPSSFKLKRSFLPPLIKQVTWSNLTNLKTTCYLRPNYFLWTKLLENFRKKSHICRCNFNGALNIKAKAVPTWAEVCLRNLALILFGPLALQGLNWIIKMTITSLLTCIVTEFSAYFVKLKYIRIVS